MEPVREFNCAAGSDFLGRPGGGRETERMKILIVGAGDVGSYLSAILSERGHSVTLIETRANVAEEVDEAQNIKVVHGNGSSASTLLKSGVEECAFFLAMTNDDRANLVGCSIAKHLGAAFTVARIHDATYTDTSNFNYQFHFGVDYLLNPEALCAVELAKRIRHPGRVAVENIARGQIEVTQVRVSGKCRLTGKPLKELRLGGNLRIGYIQRGEDLHVATAETTLQEGDLATLFGNPEVLYETKSRLDPSLRSDAVRVVISGGEETGLALARLLSNPRFKVRIIDDDPERCHELAERFPEVTIIHGDSASLRLLEEEQVGQADYFIACTRRDEINIVTGIQAREFGAPHVQAVIHKSDYEEVLTRLREALGFEVTVSPRLATVNEVLRLISEEPYNVVARLPGKAGLIVEYPVDPGSSAAGKTVRDIQWPEETIVVALIHKFSAHVPGPEDTILGNDRVIVITRDEHLDQLGRLLREY